MIEIPRMTYGFLMDARMDDRYRPGFGRLLIGLVFAKSFPRVADERALAAIAMSVSIREAAEWLWECDEAHLPGDCPLCGAV